MSEHPADEARDAVEVSGPTRREMLQRVVGVALASALPGCTIAEVFSDGAAAEDVVFSLSDPTYAPLLEVGGMVSVDSGPLKLLLIRAAEAEVVALDRICTHTACDMGPDQFGSFFNGSLVCGCHGSFFDTTGKRLAGPATRDLNAYPVELDFPNQLGTVRVPNGATNAAPEGTDAGMEDA